MNVDPEIIGIALGLVTAIGSAFLWLGGLSGRVKSLEHQMTERAEEREREREARENGQRDFNTVVAGLRGQMQLLGDAIGKVQVDALGRFAAGADIQRLDHKIDSIFTRLGALEKGQAEHSAMARATSESITDIKRALERRTT